MEVPSKPTRHRPSVTLAASLLLLIIVLLQAAALIQHKRQRWEAMLGDRVSFGSQFSIRIPSQFEPLADSDVRATVFRSDTRPWEHAVLLVLRPAAEEVQTLTDACKHAYRLQNPEASRLPIQATPPVSCQLGVLDAEVVIAQIGEGLVDLNYPVQVVLFATDSVQGPTVLVIMPSSTDQIARCRYLLQTMAKSARFE